LIFRTTSATRGVQSARPGSLLSYIAFAYKTDVTQDPKLSTELPKWALDESFTVEARSPVEKPTKDQIRLMMQSLLAERFGLRMHTETKVQPVHALRLAAQDRPGLQRHPESDNLCADPLGKHPNAKGDSIPPACGVFYFHTAENVFRLRVMDFTMAEISEALDYPIGRFGLMDARLVVDQTGLTGHFDFSVEFTVPPKGGAEPGGEAAEPGEIFLDALKRQAGLDVVKTTAPVTTYIVEAIHEPTPN
jgi:bla regulator protein blaR1